jgi:hypothetical protein
LRIHELHAGICIEACLPGWDARIGYHRLIGRRRRIHAGENLRGADHLPYQGGVARKRGAQLGFLH